MSMVNASSYTDTTTNAVYANYGFIDSSFQAVSSKVDENSRLSEYLPVDSDNILTKAYYLPLDSVRQGIATAEDLIFRTQLAIEENLLRKIFIDPAIDPDLEQAHFRAWDELAKVIFRKSTDTVVEDSIFELYDNLGGEEDVDPTLSPSDYNSDLGEPAANSGIPIFIDQINKNTPPNYICFDEVVFAERNLSTSCRRLISSYDDAIALSTFSYFYQLRKLMGLFLNELSCIKSSLLSDFGEQYENESQQQVALQYDAWGKMALHYAQRITKTIGAKSERLPSTEVDQISKKQAAQFQAFFAVRLNAVNSEINDIIANLKRDLIDNCDTFYFRYLSPALKMAKDISEPLEFDFVTTSFAKEFPRLAGELLVATKTLKGNFVAVYADLLERFEMMTSRVDALFGLIHEKKRYSNYISQLGDIAVKKRQILKTVDNDLYSSLFRQAPIDSSIKNSLIAHHNSLDGVEDDDSHPQYLLKDGGIITGDISALSGIRVDGVDLSEHVHNGLDGSARISALDIDYTLARAANADVAIKPLSVKVEGFVSDVLKGGIPVVDTIVLIEVDDRAIGGYEYEILYTEIV